jgi:chromosome partitioning protein
MPATVAFVSQKGGVGKSAMARALAVVAVNAKVKVALGDLDPQQQTLVRWNATRKEHRVSPSLSVEAFPGIDEALARTGDVELLILDSAGRVTNETLGLAQRVDLVVQPTGPSVDDLHPSVLVFHALTQLMIPHQRLVFALSRTLLTEEETAARDCLRLTGYEVLPGCIPERVAYRHALNCGRAPSETSDASLNTRVDALMYALLEKLGGGWREHANPRHPTN